VTQADVAEMLEEAKAGDLERVHAFVSTLVWSSNPNKDEIVTESLLTIADKLKAGLPSILLAPQLAGIVNIHSMRVAKRESKATNALSVGGDEQLARLSNELDDPASTFERAEQVRAEIALLKKMKREKPREFAVLMADYQKMSPVEYFAKHRGELLTSANAWKLRERGKKTAKKGLQEIRKDPSS